MSAPKVFISYCHYDGSVNYRDRVLSLSNQLRSEGIDCVIDQYYETTPPSKGWPLWMLDELEAADFVLVVCTPTYYRRFRANEEPKRGLGAVWEGGNITQQLYDSSGRNDKFIPIGFGSHSDVAASIPEPLRPTTYRDVSTEDGYTALYRQLTGQRAIIKPTLGTRRDLPPVSGATTGISPAIPSTPVTTVNVNRVVNRAGLLNVLDGLEPPDLTRVITNVDGALRRDRPNLTSAERVASLIGYAESSIGPGLKEVAEVVVTLFPAAQNQVFR